MFGMTKESVMTAGDLEKMERGLASTMGSSEAARKEMKLLITQVAALPGLGIKEAVKGSTQLQAVGLSAEEARESLIAFGNVVARSGGGKMEMAFVTRGLMQMMAKGKVVAEEINRQIAPVAPGIYKAIKAAYGTTDLAEIRKRVGPKKFIADINKELLKLDRVASGLGNALENVSDAGALLRYMIGSELGPSVEIGANKFRSLVLELYETESGLKKVAAFSLAGGGALASGAGGALELTASLGMTAMAIKQFGGTAAIFKGIGTAIMGLNPATLLIAGMIPVLTAAASEAKKLREELDAVAAGKAAVAGLEAEATKKGLDVEKGELKGGPPESAFAAWWQSLWEIVTLKKGFEGMEYTGTARTPGRAAREQRTPQATARRAANGEDINVTIRGGAGVSRRTFSEAVALH